MKNKYLLTSSIALFLAVLFYFFVLYSPERQIRKTVAEYWECLDHNHFNESVELFTYGSEYYGMMSMQFYQLKKNYPKIKSQITPLNEVKIQDTIIFGTKRKFVRYKFVNKNPEIKPMKITFIFWRKTGYDKIHSPIYLKNFMDWGDK
ncbi:hypothetical protein H1R16_03265 [Marnyiella aurantia]|uniref:Uncharacterized protein n=1 Tax=Marnyiella aurantia TaxID=2758037 RepID=A0A7D7LNA7_9FLAO|nr:hypothetical protein [Marnyiella aurantia]MBA5245545.1 hypothetical protein [Marnyiella aurantia]QMS99042.1 hypothetical protein H1R16_03265 [Marnyiella aurantia]